MAYAILEHISFDVRRGEVFGILGGSGGGKSTLMKHMIGLNPPIAGHIYHRRRRHRHRAMKKLAQDPAAALA